MGKFISVLLALTMMITGSGEASVSLFDAVSAQVGTTVSVSDFEEQLTDLISEYDGDYYSKIVVDTKENTIATDEDEPVSLEEYGIDYSMLETPEAVIPTVPVLEAAGREAELTDDGTVEIEGEEDFSVLPDGAEVVGEIENGTATVKIDDEYAKATVGYLNEKQAEELNLETCYDENTSKIIITNPYQTKRLVVDMKSGEKLIKTYGAKICINDGNGRYVLQFDSEDDAKSALFRLSSNKAVESACCDKVVSASSALTDSGRGGSVVMQSDRYVKYLKDSGKTNRITVAVVDTGVEESHELFKGRLVKGYDAFTKKTAQHDGNGHGTHVAGIIADNTPSSVKIMPVCVLNAGGSGTELSISLGIDYAVKKNVDIINMSLGGFCTDDNCPIAQSVKKAYKAGITVCVAAGNETTDTKKTCPAKLSQCITVASATVWGGISSFSNYGAAVDVAAPGEEICSSYIGNTYETLSGTSMASPFAAAAAAMLLTDNTELTPAQVKSKLKSCCADMCLGGWDKYSGSGLINMGILLGDSHKADTFGLQQPENLTINYQKHCSWYLTMMSVHDEDDSIGQVGEVYTYNMKSTTDRTVTTSTTDKSIAYFDGRYIIPVAPGEATITVSNGTKTIEIPLTVKKTEVWIDCAASKFGGGKGTKKEPYLISTPQQLAKLSLDVRNGKLYKNKYFKMTKDIDLKGKLWHSIAYYHYNNDFIQGLLVNDSFGGVFDGGNHKIKNMCVFDDPIQSSWGDYNAVNAEWYEGKCGLFGDLENCTVKNLGIENAYVQQDYSGILASNVYQNTTVQNCYTTGTSVGTGLVGELLNYNIRIKNCYSSASVQRGGLFGSIYSSNASGKVIVSNCFFCGEIMGSDRYVNNAGFVSGSIEGNKKTKYTELYNCFNASQAPSGIGFAQTSVNSKVNKCYYLKTNKYGIKKNKSGKLTNLKAQSAAFFKKKANFTNTKNWNKNYKWNFDSVWAINSKVNGGYPYLKKNKPLAAATAKSGTETWVDYASTKYAGGTGTKSDPYLISTAAQLAKITRVYRFGGGKGVYFKLTKDIDLSAHEWFTIGAGAYQNVSSAKYPKHAFLGTIDGGGHTVKNMTVSDGSSYSGFIAQHRIGVIKNLNFENAFVSGDQSVGIICGDQGLRSVISGCSVSGTIKGNWSVGGITGGGGTIYNCNSTADVYVKNSTAGGIAAVNNCEIVSSVFVGTVHKSDYSEYVGGIAGDLNENGIIRNCAAIGDCLTNQKQGEIINSFELTADGGRVYYYKMGVKQNVRSVTEEELKAAATFDGTDFADGWNITEGEYPVPKLQAYSFPIKNLPSDNWKNYKAKSFAAGKGTKAEPYVIATAAQLAHVSDVVRHDKMTYFRQVRDINLDGKLWNSVYDDGFYTNAQMNYDGGGHKIKNVYIKNGIGIFPCHLTKGQIANVKIEKIYGCTQAGIVGWNSAKVVNCTVSGTVYPPTDYEGCSVSATGGIVGLNDGSLSKCSFDGTLYSCSAIAGENSGTVTNCYSTGTLYNGGNPLANDRVRYCYTVMKGAQEQSWQYNHTDCYSAYDACLYGSSYDETDTSLADLKNKKTYKNWDFDAVWAIDENVNGGLPYIRQGATHKITYVPNGGTMPKISDCEYTVGYPHGLTSPVRTGYKLEGWYSDKALTKKVTAVGATDEGDVTLYAKWLPAYTVKYNSNGGTGSMSSVLVARNESYKLTANAFYKKGYKFTGWAKSKNGKVVYKNKQAVKNLAAKGKSITLYAQWKPITYTVAYYNQKGECWFGAQKFTYDKPQALWKNEYRAPKGKKFVGWATEKGGKPLYKDKQKVKNLTSVDGYQVELYAVFK